MPNLNNFNPLAGLSQEQLQPLALLQYLKNPGLFGLGFGLPQQGPQASISNLIFSKESLG